MFLSRSEVAFCQPLPVGTPAYSHTTWRSTEADHDRVPVSSVGSVFRTFECVSAGRHLLLPEWPQQATVRVHGDAQQCVWSYKANIVSLCTLASFSHPYKLGFGFVGFAEPRVRIRARNCFCCITELSRESANELQLLCKSRRTSLVFVLSHAGVFSEAGAWLILLCLVYLQSFIKQDRSKRDTCFFSFFFKQFDKKTVPNFSKAVANA